MAENPFYQLSVFNRLIIDREKSGRDDFEHQRFRDDSGEKPSESSSTNYDFYTYGSYAQMVTWMHALARKYKSIVQFISVGKSHEGRSIDGLEVGDCCYILLFFLLFFF